MYLQNTLGQFTRNYTQTVKRAADNKRRYAPGWVHSTCLLRGFPKGAAPHLAHDFAEQSVVCYTLCRRCPENTVAAGEGKGIWRGRKAGLCLGLVSRKQRADFSSRQGVLWKPPSLVLRPRPMGQKVPKLWTPWPDVWPHSGKSSRTAGNRQGWNEWADARPWPFPAAPLDGWTRWPIPKSVWPHSFILGPFFSQNWNGRESPKMAFPPWLPISKDGRDCQRRRWKRRSSWPLTGSPGFATARKRWKNKMENKVKNGWQVYRMCVILCDSLRLEGGLRVLICVR